MEEEFVSKSQQKREAKALQELGVDLIALAEAELLKLPLSEHLHKAIMDAKRIKSHGAKKRQELLVGKLLRSADSEAILEAYENIQLENSAQTAHFHQAEQWRDRLLQDPQALTEFISQYPPENIQQFRQFVKKAIQEQHLPQKTGASKNLFRYIRSCIS